jgi:hypothetical protein
MRAETSGGRMRRFVRFHQHKRDARFAETFPDEEHMLSETHATRPADFSHRH